MGRKPSRGLRGITLSFAWSKNLPTPPKVSKDRGLSGRGPFGLFRPNRGLELGVRANRKVPRSVRQPIACPSANSRLAWATRSWPRAIVGERRRAFAARYYSAAVLGVSSRLLLRRAAQKRSRPGTGKRCGPKMAQCEQRARGRATDRLDRKQLGQLCETPAANCRNLTSDRTAEKPVAVSRARRASAIRDGQTAGRSPTDRSPRQTQIA